MLDQPRRVIAAACDGACSGNPGPGGWGALLRFEDGAVRELGGADPATTNNRMELTAALALYETLRDLPRHPELVIRTDSRYLIDGLQKWLPGWKRKGWRTASGGQVLNRDLWERLERARLADVRLVHVRGHSGDVDNDRCDAIAVAFARGTRPQLAREAADGTPADLSEQQASSGAPPPRGSATTRLTPDSGTAAATATGRSRTAGRNGGGTASSAAAVATAAPARGDAAPHDLAPPPLQQLLTRLELAERLAQGGFALTLLELAQLVEMPLRTLEARSEAWTWRDWRVQPAGEGRWRLERDAGGLETRE
jgi:ribonuclease HI